MCSPDLLSGMVLGLEGKILSDLASFFVDLWVGLSQLSPVFSSTFDD